MRLTNYMLALSLAVTPAAAQAQAMSREVRAYLTAALDTIQMVTMGRDTIPWQQVRDSALYFAFGARTTREAHGAVWWALQRANRHSFLQADRPGLLLELLPGQVAYMRVPQRGGPGVTLADSLHDAVRAFQSQGACGWIVDLRSNGGGNMWPMLAGIGPLLGDSIVGYFGTGASAESWYYRNGVSGIRKPDGTMDTITRITVPPVAMISPSVPVAVLTDGGTASSGEAVAVAFLGRPSTRVFGIPTAGFATVNRGSRLPDSANMVVTTGYYTNRRGVQQPRSIAPDSVIEGSVVGWPYATDRVAGAAASWLQDQSACMR